MLGHYKSERGEAGLSAKPVALRDHNSYSVILGRFRNEGYGETVTLAQVFWFKEPHGQPARFHVVADRPLTIREHFSGFGRDINTLKKRLRKLPHVEIYDSFPPYGGAFRRRFGIASEQALDLFHQTVSMKAVGDLTDFVRNHMLEPFQVEERIGHMIAHFEDLTRAHEAVLKARRQIERLTPIVADCDAHAEVAALAEDLRASREALHAFFAGHKAALLDKRIVGLDADIARHDERITALRETRREQDSERDALKQAILENGGDRIAALGREIDAKGAARAERQQRAEGYSRIAAALGFAEPRDADAFLANRSAIVGEIETARKRNSTASSRRSPRPRSVWRLARTLDAYTILAASLAYQFGLDISAPRSRAFHFVVIDEAFGRGSDESARFGLDLFKKMGLQLLIVTPLQKIHIIEPYVAAVGFVHNEEGRRSRLRNLTIEEYRAERLKRAG